MFYLTVAFNQPTDKAFSTLSRLMYCGLAQEAAFGLWLQCKFRSDKNDYHRATLFSISAAGPKFVVSFCCKLFKCAATIYFITLTLRFADLILYSKGHLLSVIGRSHPERIVTDIVIVLPRCSRTVRGTNTALYGTGKRHVLRKSYGKKTF